MRDDRDEFIQGVVDELKTLPPVPAGATARVLARVEAARRSGGSASDVDDDMLYFPATTEEHLAPPMAARPLPAAAHAGARGRGGFGRRLVVSLPAAIGYALAATLAGFLIRGAMPRATPSPVLADVRVGNSASAGSGVAVVPAARAVDRAAQEAPVPVQFTLDARRAAKVALVADFNGWDATAAPLVRDSASGVWSTVAEVTPGRHVYAFLVDGTTWTLDPRAPRVKDADYGSEQSVIIVGLP